MKADFNLNIKVTGIAMENATKALRRGQNQKKVSNRNTTKKIQKKLEKVNKVSKSQDSEDKQV